MNRYDLHKPRRKEASLVDGSLWKMNDAGRYERKHRQDMASLHKFMSSEIEVVKVHSDGTVMCDYGDGGDLFPLNRDYILKYYDPMP